MIEVTAGVHNFTCVAWCSSVGLILVTLILRVAYAFMIRKIASTRGITYIPKGSLGAKSFLWMQPNHREEALLLIQSTPQSYQIPLRFVPGHVETVKEHAGLHVDVEVVGSGTCTVALNVDMSIFQSIRNFQSLGSFASVVTETQAFEHSQSLRFPIPAISTDGGAGKVPLMVFVLTNGDIEATMVLPDQTVQCLISRDGSVNIVPIFSQNVEECMVCYDTRSNVVLLDCRHCCMCYECMQRLRDSRCIVCRHRFNKFLYLPRSVGV